MEREAQPIAPSLYSRGEQRADLAVHLVAVAAAWIGGFWLILSAFGRLAEGQILALGLYAVSMAGMFSNSTAYHQARRPAVKERLRRLDHALIYAAIAGTYSPLLTRLPAGQAVPALLLVWLLAITGMALKLLMPHRFERGGLALYLGLGWIGLPMIPLLSGRLLPATGWWIAAGGAIYTLGIGAYLAQRIRYHNVLWHVMVLLAAACHYRAIIGEFSP